MVIDRIFFARQIYRFVTRCKVETVAAHYIPTNTVLSPLPLCAPNHPRAETDVTASQFVVVSITRFYGLCKGILRAVCELLSACPSAVRCDRCLVRETRSLSCSRQLHHWLSEGSLELESALARRWSESAFGHSLLMRRA